MLVQKHYVENKKIISLEGNLLRLAMDHKIPRNEFIKIYIGNEINPNLKKFLDTNLILKQFFTKNKEEGISDSGTLEPNNLRLIIINTTTHPRVVSIPLLSIQLCAPRALNSTLGWGLGSTRRSTTGSVARRRASLVWAAIAVPPGVLRAAVSRLPAVACTGGRPLAPGVGRRRVSGMLTPHPGLGLAAPIPVLRRVTPGVLDLCKCQFSFLSLIHI